MDNPPHDRHGWDLVTSRPLSPEQTRRADELAAVESGTKKVETKRKRKEKPR